MPNAVGSAITTGTADCTGRPMDKFHGTLKNYPGLNRKSGKSFKSTSKSLNSNPCKSKRVRTIFTPEQLERLETEFERQQYMVGSGRHYLASTLNLSEAQVKVWFQNRRMKERRFNSEDADSMGDE